MMRHVKEMLNTIKPGLSFQLPVCILTRTIIRTALFKQNGTTTERTLMAMCQSTKLKADYPEAAFSRERLCILHMIEVAIKIGSTKEELSSKSFR